MAKSQFEKGLVVEALQVEVLEEDVLSKRDVRDLTSAALENSGLDARQQCCLLKILIEIEDF